MIETTAIPRRNPSSASRTVDGQAVIALSDAALIHILNDVGTRVWNLIDGQRNVEEIIAAVRDQLVQEGYESVPAELANDVEGFLEEIRGKGMITMGGAGG